MNLCVVSSHSSYHVQGQWIISRCKGNVNLGNLLLKDGSSYLGILLNIVHQKCWSGGYYYLFNYYYYLFNYYYCCLNLVEKGWLALCCALIISYVHFVGNLQGLYIDTHFQYFLSPFIILILITFININNNNYNI